MTGTMYSRDRRGKASHVYGGEGISGRGNGKWEKGKRKEWPRRNRLTKFKDSTEPVWLGCIKGLKRHSLKWGVYGIMHLNRDWSGERLGNGSRSRTG